MPSSVDILRQLGGKVRRIRQERAWSQEELAHRSGLDRTYVSGIERGRRNPTVLTLEQIALALDVPVASLLMDD